MAFRIHTLVGTVNGTGTVSEISRSSLGEPVLQSASGRGAAKDSFKFAEDGMLRSFVNWKCIEIINHTPHTP